MDTTTPPLAPVIADLRRKAAALRKRIVLPEGEDKRTLKAAAVLKKDGLCVPILLGDPEKARAIAAAEGADISGIEIVDPVKDAKYAEYAAQYFELRKHKGVDEAEARKSAPVTG